MEERADREGKTTAHASIETFKEKLKDREDEETSPNKQDPERKWDKR